MKEDYYFAPKNYMSSLFFSTNTLQECHTPLLFRSIFMCVKNVRDYHEGKNQLPQIYVPSSSSAMRPMTR